MLFPVSDATPISSANEKLADPGAFDSAKIDETANMTDLDDYLDLLYEDTTEQLRGSALILQLARNPDNLEELFQNEHEIQNYARWMEELKRIRAEQGEDCPEYKQNAEKYEDLVRKQEQLLRGVLIDDLFVCLAASHHCMGTVDHRKKALESR
ncbi:Kinesin-associated protein 3 [Echinococcus granulosus]|uniref:Kinesin-associated protein 3 n=1 Tax=Echinococcus granulosus TaxID=6210 RepID=W6V4M1_ECHGR|nr:Kinesin-associated protein 3 [Echinococcus granulosus]EUB61109.1 Kinesin-associated protein 3 [Echinococcus granulosus]